MLQVRGKAPLMPLGLFRLRGVTGSNIVMLLVGAVFFSMWYFLSLYLQDVLGYGALRAGLAFLPMGIAIIVGAQATSRAMPRTGIRPLLFTGTALAAGGFLWLSRIGAGSHYWDAVFGPGVIIALALGVLFPPLAAAATAGVGRSEAGLASGVLNTARQVGGSLGLAILATVASTRTHALERAGLAPDRALTEGFARAFLLAGLLGIVAFAAAFIVPARSGRSAPATVPGPPDQASSRTLPTGAAPPGDG